MIFGKLDDKVCNKIWIEKLRESFCHFCMSRFLVEELLVFHDFEDDYKIHLECVLA
jgi:hypothetical protein